MHCKRLHIQRAALGLAAGLLAVSLQAADAGTVPATAQTQVQEQVQQLEHRELEQNEAIPEVGVQGRQQERNANTGEPPVQDPAVRQGPYGDKQYHKKQGSPASSGEQARPGKQGSH